MKHQTRFVLPLFAAVAMLVPSLSAAEKKAKFTDWDLGKVAFGEKLGRKDTKGKVIILEYWGVNCPPCIASLPHLAELDREHRDKGLVVIGAECQLSTKDEMKPLLEKAKVEYTIVEGAEGPIEVTGIPRVFVFGTDGLLAFDGKPFGKEFEDAVTNALGSSGSEAEAEEAEPAGNLIEQRDWTNAAGGKIQAAVTKADGKTVTFLMANGKSVDYPVAKLSEESREAIAAALKGAGDE